LATAFILIYLYTTRVLNFLGEGNLFLYLSITSVALLIALIAGTSWWLNKVLKKPITDLLRSAKRIASGDRSFRAPVESHDEIGELAKTFNELIDQFDADANEMRDVAQLESNEAKKRSYYLEAAAKVGQAASSILDTDELIQTVVNLIQERFNLYYVGLFLLGNSKESAVLHAGTGDAGRKMVQRGHQITVGEGMIGWCIANAQTRIAQEAEDDTRRLATEELPKTRSEAALPLRSRNQVIGALTVQSEYPRAFDEDTLIALETMAGLVAVAIDNSILFEQSQEALETMRKAYRLTTRKAWQELLEERPSIGVYCDKDGVRSINGLNPLAATDKNHLPELCLPIQIRGHQIGNIAVHKPSGSSEWTEDEIRLIQKLTDQLSIALDSARLYKDSQMRAERERLAREITAKLRASNDPGTILRTAVQELRLAIQADKVQVLMKPTIRQGQSITKDDNGHGSKA
jgi:GAF domain-containing protein/HAMP domain-containing protein